MEHWRHAPPTPRRYRSKQSKGRLLVSHIHQWETKGEGEDKNHRHLKGEANKSLVVLHDNVLTRDVPRTRGCTDQSRTHSCQRTAAGCDISTDLDQGFYISLVL